jgi:hydrogenase maturation factor
MVVKFVNQVTDLCRHQRLGSDANSICEEGTFLNMSFVGIQKVTTLTVMSSTLDVMSNSMMRVVLIHKTVAIFQLQPIAAQLTVVTLTNVASRTNCWSAGLHIHLVSIRGQ